MSIGWERFKVEGDADRVSTTWINSVSVHFSRRFPAFEAKLREEEIPYDWFRLSLFSVCNSSTDLQADIEKGYLKRTYSSSK